jgi:hypothetical protein
MDEKIKKEIEKAKRELRKKYPERVRNVYTNFARMSYEEQMDLIMNWTKARKKEMWPPKDVQDIKFKYENGEASKEELISAVEQYRKEMLKEAQKYMPKK